MLALVQPIIESAEGPAPLAPTAFDRHMAVGIRRDGLSVPRLRHRTTAFLNRCGLPKEPRSDAETVVSEFAGNAVRHTDGLILRAYVACVGRRVVIIVVDEGPRRHPLPFPTTDAWATTGRGLAIVDALCERHGHTAHGLATTAWAVLAW